MKPMKPMKPSPSRIGFDRFIALDWAVAALRVRAGTVAPDELSALLDSAMLGVEARKKVSTVLNRLWLAPHAELADFANRAVNLYKNQPDTPVVALCWGMAIASYPFFGKVVELVGRLSAIQSDCATAEVHRRMSELYGEREGTRRTTNVVIQTQASWGVIERVETGKRVIRLASIQIEDGALIAWLVEAALRSIGKSVSITALPSLPILFPFAFTGSFAYAIARSDALMLRNEGPINQVVALRETVLSVP